MKVRFAKVAMVAGLISIAMIGGVAASSHSTGIPEADKRIAKMKELGKNMKAIAAVAKGEAAYSPALNDNAKMINAIAGEFSTLFPAGSGGEKTRAKPDIWQKTVEFSTARENFRMAAAALVKGVATGDQAMIGQALQATGKTCGGCHKPFRVPKKDK